jgi:hemolysin activation/secretion protein
MKTIKMRVDPRFAKAFCPQQVCGQKTISKILVTFLLSSFAVCSLAQQRPDPFSSYKQQQQLPEAGSTYKQIEQGLRLPMPSLSEEKKAEEPKEANNSVLSVSVTKFNVLGNTLLSQLQIDEVLNPYVGKSLTFDDLQKVVQILIEQYKQSDWIVRAYLPKQEVGNGEIVIQVVEAKFGGTSFENTKKSRISEARMLAMVESVQQKERFIRSGAIDRVLLLLDDVPGVGVTGNLVEGKGEGQTDLLLKIVDKPLLNGYATVDNTGSASTGPNKFSSSATLNSLLGFGDQLQASVVRTTGSAFARFAFSAPIGYDGMRAGVHYSTMNYKLVGSFSGLSATGSVKDGGLDLSYPLVRGPSQNLNVTLVGSHKELNNYATGIATSTYTMDTTNLTYSGNSSDEWSGGGMNAGSLSFSSGYVNLNGSINQPSDAQTYQTAGKYFHTNLNLSREQNLNDQLTAYASYAAQYANKNLDSSEKMYLGGANGVRAYPTNEGGGAAGQIATFELRERLDEHWNLTGFYDYGKIKQYQINLDVNNNPLSVNSPNTYALQGYGATVGWRSVGGTDIKATVAKRVGENPAANLTTKMDSDGTYRNPRIWVVATVPF